ncbi:flagellin N-terminal helical domain-containing protein [Planctobacterium marinum]|uniref:flagellin N-terminal helical domain-containing protein n=1 Tax=Planctobacterium marinum TaxID=1631968 RepID=UPI001E54C7AB|nr:flagellin [Planctobacterium marinum]MCC2606799.1 flagellin [Planctobacterium marinum]
MSLFVNTNVSALQANRQLFNSSAALDVSFQRLSSGFRIDSAADDAAGLQISNRMTSSVLGDGQVVRNLNDGISYAQIAEGGLAETTQILQRMRQLAVQAQNGIMTEADREALNKEVLQLKTEMDRIANTTQAFGRYPLLGESINNVPPIQSIGDVLANGVENTGLPSGLTPFGYIPAGSTNVNIEIDGLPGAEDDIQIFTVNGTHLVGTELGNHSWTSNGVANSSDFKDKVFTSENGFADHASYNDTLLNTGGVQAVSGYGNFTYSGENDLNNNGSTPDAGAGETTNIETLHIDTVGENLILMATGQGVFNITASWDALGNGQGKYSTLAGNVRITATNTADTDLEFIGINDTPATTAALGLATLDISSAENAEKSLALIDNAIETVGSYRGSYGANVNEMQSTLRNIQTQQENVSAARSRIRDTDYASETAELTQNQIVQQASTSILAQANNQPQLALSLLG